MIQSFRGFRPLTSSELKSIFIVLAVSIPEQQQATGVAIVKLARITVTHAPQLSASSNPLAACGGPAHVLLAELKEADQRRAARSRSLQKCQWSEAVEHNIHPAHLSDW